VPSELNSLEKAGYQTQNGNPHHFLVTGERGIGKSFLLLFLEILAKGKITHQSDARFRFFVVNVVLDPALGYTEIIEKIGAELARVVSSENELRNLPSRLGFLE
jgi:RecA-family ATPase